MRVTSLVALAVMLGVAASGAGAELQATFIGNMGVHVTDGTAAMLTDFPYEAGASGYKRWSKANVPKGPAPLCLFTHSHADHFARELVGEFCAAALGPQDVVQKAGVPVQELTAVVRWQGITIRPLGTRHGSLEHYSYLVEWGGTRLFFSGDTEDIDTLLATRNLDAAFVSPVLLDSVHKSGGRIDARQVIVYGHSDGESVPSVQGRIVPRQGQVMKLGSR